MNFERFLGLFIKDILIYLYLYNYINICICYNELKNGWGCNLGFWLFIVLLGCYVWRNLYSKRLKVIIFLG